MGNRQSEDFSRYDPPMEESAEYGDEYPVILCEQDIEPEKRKILKGLIQGNSSISVFSFLYEALIFAEQLGTSFILIVTSHYDEQDIIQNSQGFREMHARSMFDFEEEAILKDLFGGASNGLIESLNVKAYFFTTHQDLRARLPYDENEEEVMLMRDVKDMAKLFRQESIIIWYDPHLQHEVKTVLAAKFDIEEKNIYTKFEELFKRIHDPNSPSYHLILTGKDEVRIIVEEITNLNNLLCLYIYDDNPVIIKQKCSSKIIIQESIEKLVPKITQGLRTKSKLTNSFPAFATHFNSSDKSDIFKLHYYLRGLLNFQNRKQAKEDFIQLAKKVYESKKIFTFEQEYDQYKKEEIFKWYTMESPVYKLVNNCLRIATSDSILYSRFFFKDLERAIREEYQEKSHQYNGAVFRGTYISQGGWEKLQGNIGKEIEMYGFLSTSQKIETAKNFLYPDLQNKILITIIIPPLPAPELNEQGFANISQNSNFDEAEILFNVRSKFRILEAGTTKINDRGKECRHLILLYGAHLLRRYMTKEKPIIRVKLKFPFEIKCRTCGSIHKLFGFNQRGTKFSCMTCVGKGFVPKDTPLLALDSERITKGERMIEKSFKGKRLELNQAASFPFYGYKCQNCLEMGKDIYYKWIDSKREVMNEQCSDCFQSGKEMKADILLMESKPYIIWQESQSEEETIDDKFQIKESKSVRYASQGEVYVEVKRFDWCLKYEKKVIKKLGKKRWRELEKLQSLERIGFAFWKSENHQQALKYFYQNLNMKKVFYGEKHSETATTYNNIAAAHASLGQYQEALDFYKKALEIRKSIFGESHPETADTYSNIAASVYGNLGQYQEALKFNKKVLEIRKTIFGDKHPETAATYNNYALILMELGQYEEALDFFKKTLEIKKSVFGEMDPETAITYNNIGLTKNKMGQYEEALGHYKKALEISRTISGDRYPGNATPYLNYACTLRCLGRYQEALHFFKKSLDLRRTVSGDRHPETAATYSDIAFVYDDLGQYQEALEHHKKALDLRKIIFGDEHPKTIASLKSYESVCKCLEMIPEDIGDFSKDAGSNPSAQEKADK